MAAYDYIVTIEIPGRNGKKQKTQLRLPAEKYANGSDAEAHARKQIERFGFKVISTSVREVPRGVHKTSNAQHRSINGFFGFGKRRQP